MRRGRQQILFNFLPGKTFDHESGQAICRVTRFEAEEDKRLNQRYVLYRVAWLLNQWPEERRRGFPDPYRQPDRYVFASPRGVKAEIFPLLFYCNNPGCRRVTSYRDLNQANNRDLRCKTCGSGLTQFHHVLIHQCGDIQPFIVPGCRQHGYDHMSLDTRSQKYSRFRWRCRLCSFQSPIIYGQFRNSEYGKCKDCSLPDRTMRPVVHRATSSYYPQYRTLINLPGQDLVRILEDPGRHWLAIAAYLRLFDHGPDNRLVDLVSAQTGQEESDETDTLRRMLKTAPAGQVREWLEQQLKDGEDRRGQIINRAKELISLEEAPLEDAGQELLEFVRPDETLQITSVAQLESKAQQEMPGRLPIYRVAYREAMRDTGLRDVRLIGDFPVTTVVIGYTRNEREADNTVIRAFHRLKQDDPRTPLFVDTTETEALMFRLDPARVIRWLGLNGLTEDDNLPDNNDEVAVRAWILNRMRSVNPFQEIPETDPVNRAVYGLVHTFSHLVLRQAVIQSGFDRTSLSEYLFPRALSFVIYSNNRSGFTIGGLYTLFEQTLHEHLRAVLDRSEACVYDPVCIEETGACHACLHISEMSCEHFNRNLNRKYLFGRTEPDGSEFIGYWDERCTG